MEILTGVDVPLTWVLLPLSLLLLYLYATWPFGQFQSLGISGPPPKPFLGNMAEMRTKGNLYALLDWSKQYGRVYGIFLGRQPAIVASDLDILKEVMVKDFSHFTDRWTQNAQVISKTVTSGVFFAGGEDWRRIRNIITPTFSAGKLRMMEPFINRCSADLADNLQEIAAQQGLVDVKRYFGAYTMDVIAGTAFGLQVNSQKDLDEPLVSTVKTMMDRAGRRPAAVMLVEYFPFLATAIGNLRNMRAFTTDTFQFLFDSIDTMIEQRKQDQQEKRPVDFLQLLLNAEANDGSAGAHKRLTRTEVKGQMFVFFIAGYETTATTLQYLAYNLAMYPDIQQRIVDEMKEQLGEDTPTYDNVGKLKYMEQTIHETLRLFPPVTMVTRVASETATIKGVTIPKGFTVIIPICDVLRDPQYFPQPEVFNPDRFSDKAAMEAISFLPFGFGPRLCIGMRLAMLEIKIAMVHVLRRMRFVKSPDLPEKVTFKPVGGLLPPATPLMVKAVLADGQEH